MAKKIYKGHSLSEYQSKYASKGLKVVEKVEADKNPNILNDKSWWLIGDKYFEVPTSKCPPIAWWRNLTTTGKVITCVLGAGVIATAIAVPVAITANQNKGNITVELIEGTVGISVASTKKLDNGALEITLKPDAGKELASIEKIVIGNQNLTINVDYTLVGNVITINKEVVEKHKGEKVIITPKVQDSFDPAKEFECDSEFCNVSYSKKQGNDHVYEISIKNDYKETKELQGTMEYIKVGDYVLVTTPTPEYVIAKDGDKLLLTINGDVFKAHQGKIQIKPKVVAKTETIVLNKTSLDIGIGENRAVQLVATTSPEGGEVTWESSNPNKVSVTSGLVTALAPTDEGEKVIITARSGSKTATCEVTSYKYYYIDWDKTILKDGKTLVQLFSECDHVYFGKPGDVFEHEEEMPAAEYDIEDVGSGTPGNKIKAYYQNHALIRGGLPTLVIRSEGRIAFKDNGTSPFANLTNTFELDLRGVDFSEFKSFDGLFKDSKNLGLIWNAQTLQSPSVTSMANMFSGCKNLIEVKNLSKVDTSNITDMSNMFKGCYSYPYFNLSSFDTSKVTNMSHMFDMTLDNDFPETIDQKIFVSDKFVTSAVTDDTDMFLNCNHLEGGKGTKCDGETNIGKDYARLDKGTDNPGYFTAVDEIPYDINWEGKDFGPEGEKCSLKDYLSSSTSVEFIQSDDTTTGQQCGRTSDDKIYFTFDNSELKIWSKNKIAFNDLDCVDMFVNCTQTTNINFENIDTKKISTIENMFRNFNCCAELDLSNIDTFNVSRMGYAFTNSNLNRIFASNKFKTFKALNYGDQGNGMFDGSLLYGPCSTNVINRTPWEETALEICKVDGGITFDPDRGDVDNRGIFWNKNDGLDYYFLEYKDSQYSCQIDNLPIGTHRFIVRITNGNSIKNFKIEKSGQKQLFDFAGINHVFVNGEYDLFDMAGGSFDGETITLSEALPTSQNDFVFMFEISNTVAIKDAVPIAFKK